MKKRTKTFLSPFALRIVEYVVLAVIAIVFVLLFALSGSCNSAPAMTPAATASPCPTVSSTASPYVGVSVLRFALEQNGFTQEEGRLYAANGVVFAYEQTADSAGLCTAALRTPYYLAVDGASISDVSAAQNQATEQAILTLMDAAAPHLCDDPPVAETTLQALLKTVNKGEVAYRTYGAYLLSVELRVTDDAQMLTLSLSRIAN